MFNGLITGDDLGMASTVPRAEGVASNGNKCAGEIRLSIFRGTCGEMI